jgi:hypothetical protein
MRKYTKRIAVIGNAEPTGDVSKMVDSADTVIRFNSSPYFQSGLTGKHTDILCVRSFGEIGEKFANGSEKINPQVILACHTVWFVGEKGGWTPKIINRFMLEDTQHVHFTSEHMFAVDKLLHKFGGASQGSSLGTMAIVFLLSRPEFKHCSIELFCFGFEGWQGHPWKQEIRLLMFYQYREKIRFYPHQAFSARVPVLSKKVSIDKEGFVNKPDQTDRAIRTNETGRWILEHIDGRTSFGTLCSKLRKEMGDAPENFDLEIAQYVWELEDLNLLTWQ